MTRTVHRHARFALAALALVSLLAACQNAGAGSPSAATSVAEDATVAVADSANVGQHVVDAEGWTLYVFTTDMAGHSMCVDDCAAAWPPALVEEGEQLTAGEGVSAELGTIERTEGLQLTLDGHPLYRYAEDQAPGDVTGEGVGGVWFVARPDGAMPEASGSAGSSDDDDAEESDDGAEESEDDDDDPY